MSTWDSFLFNGNTVEQNALFRTINNFAALVHKRDTLTIMWIHVGPSIQPISLNLKLQKYIDAVNYDNLYICH